jgi:glutamyl-tRNA reductase
VSLLVTGLSYRTAPLVLLERTALTEGAARALERRLCLSDHIAEAAVLSTCNRLEIYAEVSAFHGGIAHIGEELIASTGVPLDELTGCLYIHYDAAAVSHLFAVVSGLDSMAVGEPQILGQVRGCMRAAADTGSVGRALSAVFQHALRTGKRAHAETALDHAGHTLVEAGLARAAALLGPVERSSVLVVGAGVMSGLAATTAARAGAGDITVVNRTASAADRLAAEVGGRSVPFAKLPEALADADVVISCTGALGHVLTAGTVEVARARRHGDPQVYLDLAVPRDVEPDVAELAGITLIDLDELGRCLAADLAAADLTQVRRLVTEEVDAFLTERRAEAVAPTVVALRALARSVMQTELTRLSGRLGEVDGRVRDEIELTVHRVVDKLLHTPTVRVKQLAGEPGGDAYATALRALFDLDLSEATTACAVAPVAPVVKGTA